MEQVLKAMERDIGKGAARQLRREGTLPAVIYGKGQDPMAVALNHQATVRVLAAVGRNAVIQLELEGERPETMNVMVKEVQRDVFTGFPYHLDLVRIIAGQRVTVSVPVRVVGDEEIIGAGFIVQQNLRGVDVESLAVAVPDFALADVSGMTVGDTLTVAQLALEGEGDIQNDPDELVVAITAPRASTEGAEEAAEEDVETAKEPTR